MRIFATLENSSTGAFYADDWFVGLLQTSSLIAPGAVGTQQIANEAVTAALMASNSITAANAALAALSIATGNLQDYAVTPLQVLSVYAESVEADTSVLGQLIAGSITIAMSLTTGGSIVSDQGASFVGINALGHALVAANTTTGASSVLDDGYLDTSALFNFGVYMASLTALFGVPQTVDELPEMAMTLGVANAATAAAYAQLYGRVNGLGAFFTLYDDEHNAAIYMSASSALGTCIVLAQSASVPSGLPGLLYFDGAHLYIYIGGAYHTII
jgi:hypothetical protein